MMGVGSLAAILPTRQGTTSSFLAVNLEAEFGFGLYAPNVTTDLVVERIKRLSIFLNAL